MLNFKLVGASLNLVGFKRLKDERRLRNFEKGTLNLGEIKLKWHERMHIENFN